MRKLIVIIFLLFIFTGFTSAQDFQFYRITPRVLISDTSLMNPVPVKGLVKNISSQKQSFRFIRIYQYLPDTSWKAYFCVAHTCYPYFVDTVPSRGAPAFELMPGAQDTMLINTIGRTPGTATFVIKVHTLTSPNVYIIDTFGIKMRYPVGIKQESTNASSYFLGQNFPNPFNPVTIIRFMLKDARIVSLRIFDITGREIAKPVDNTVLNEGFYTYKLDADYLKLSSGIYYYMLDVIDPLRQTVDFRKTLKMVLIK